MIAMSNMVVSRLTHAGPAAMSNMEKKALRSLERVRERLANEIGKNGVDSRQAAKASQAVERTAVRASAKLSSAGSSLLQNGALVNQLLGSGGSPKSPAVATAPEAPGDTSTRNDEIGASREATASAVTGPSKSGASESAIAPAAPAVPTTPAVPAASAVPATPGAPTGGSQASQPLASPGQRLGQSTEQNESSASARRGSGSAIVGGEGLIPPKATAPGLSRPTSEVPTFATLPSATSISRGNAYGEMRDHNFKWANRGRGFDVRERLRSGPGLNARSPEKYISENSDVPRRESVASYQNWSASYFTPASSRLGRNTVNVPLKAADIALGVLSLGREITNSYLFHANWTQRGYDPLNRTPSRWHLFV